MKHMNRAGVLVAALAALTFTACNDSMNPIFYTISREVPIADSSLPNELTIQDMTETDAIAPADDRYYVAALKVFSRLTDSGSDWVPVAPPQSGAGAIAIEFFGGELYAGFFINSNGNGLGLYRLNDPDDPASGWDNSTISPTFEDKKITLLEEAGTELFVGIEESDGEHYLYAFDAPGTPLLTGLASAVLDITWIGGSSYLAIAGQTVFGIDTTSLPGTALSPQPPSVAAGSDFGGIFFSSDGNTYLSTTGGQLYVSGDDGANWTGPHTAGIDAGVDFTRFTEIVADNVILVGTWSHGYYQFTDDGSFGNLVRRPDFNIELHDEAVFRFFIGSTPAGALFAGSAGAGLWRSDDNGVSWARE